MTDVEKNEKRTEMFAFLITDLVRDTKYFKII